MKFCAACDQFSEDDYRCSKCGHDLAGQGEVVARHGGERL